MPKLCTENSWLEQEQDSQACTLFTQLTKLIATMLQNKKWALIVTKRSLRK